MIKKRITKTAAGIIAVFIFLAGCGAAGNSTDIVGNSIDIARESTDAALPETRSIQFKTDDRMQPERSYAAAYYHFLKESYAESEGAKFALAYIDDNEIPELLLMKDDAYTAGVDIYTFTDDGIINLGNFGFGGSMQYVERQGLIYSRFVKEKDTFSTGKIEEDFFMLEDGQLSKISSEKPEDLYQEHEYTLIFYVNAAFVQESELERLLTEELEGLVLTQEENFRKKY